MLREQYFDLDKDSFGLGLDAVQMIFWGKD